MKYLYVEDEAGYRSPMQTTIESVLRNEVDETEVDEVNISLLLAAQLGNSELAREAGYLEDDMLIYAPGMLAFAHTADGPLLGLISVSGVISLGELIEAVERELSTHPNAKISDPWWTYQYALRLVLDAVNSEAIMRIGL